MRKFFSLAGVAYYITLPFIYLLSLLPYRVLYLLSDIVYLVLFRLLGYRKAVIMKNLRNSFPQKTDAELLHIARNFESYLCDLLLETFKTLTTTPASMLRHCSLDPKGRELFRMLAEKKQSIIIVLGHYGNWEWAGNTFSLLCPQQLYVIYHPLKNPYFNGLITRMRMRFGSKLITMRNTYKDMLANRNEVNATAFVADQTPHQPQHAHWTTFLNQDTPVFKGTENLARKLNYPVVYVSVKRVKRGYYEMSAEMLCAHPGATAEGEITELHTRRLEKDIVAQPEIWLWSHRRWKYTRTA